MRQHVKGLPTVGVLGAGKLAREILPWLIGKTKVRVFYRNLQHAEDLLNEYPEIELVQYSEADAGWLHDNAGLVIAAPLQAQQVINWARQQTTGFAVSLDLRGEAETGPLSMTAPVIKLHELFEALRAERERLQATSPPPAPKSTNWFGVNPSRRSSGRLGGKTYARDDRVTPQ